MWYSKLKYETLGDVINESKAEYGDTLLDPHFHRRMDEFTRGVKIYNWGLIWATIAAILIIVLVILL